MSSVSAGRSPFYEPTCKLKPQFSPVTSFWRARLGKSPLIDALVRDRKVDVSSLRSQWESFIIVTVPRPLPGVEMALAIIGSDRRGTAFGIYELSQAIGVSPWNWWADVTPEHRRNLVVSAGLHRYGPPSVQYRGVFLNDEDWGLQPWAAKTYEPERGDIGPQNLRAYLRITAPAQGQHALARNAQKHAALQSVCREQAGGRRLRSRHGIVTCRADA